MRSIADAFLLQVIPKNDDSRRIISQAVSDSVLFHKMEQGEKSDAVDAFFPVHDCAHCMPLRAAMLHTAAHCCALPCCMLLCAARC